MNLIAHFVFETGEPIDVIISQSKKDEFLRNIEDGKCFWDEKGECGFYANLSKVKLFHISKENINPTTETEEKTETEPMERQNFDDLM